MVKNYVDGVISNLPVGLVEVIRDRLGIKNFVETGTQYGFTAGIAARLFEKVWTIELNASKWQKAKQALSKCRNVTCLLGDSTEALPEVVKALRGPTLFFLDAHCFIHVERPSTGCPLLAELATVREGDAVLIDDVKFFITLPRPTLLRAGCPEMVEVIDGLRARGDNPFIFVFGNCFVSVPRKIRAPVTTYIRAHTDYVALKTPE